MGSSEKLNRHYLSKELIREDWATKFSQKESNSMKTKRDIEDRTRSSNICLTVIVEKETTHIKRPWLTFSERHKPQKPTFPPSKGHEVKEHIFKDGVHLVTTGKKILKTSRIMKNTSPSLTKRLREESDLRFSRQQ